MPCSPVDRRTQSDGKDSNYTGRTNVVLCNST